MKIELFDAEGRLILYVDGDYIRDDSEGVETAHDFYSKEIYESFSVEKLKNATMLIDGKKYIEKDGYFVLGENIFTEYKPHFHDPDSKKGSTFKYTCGKIDADLSK